jgi:predicted phage-related endonuclease
MSINEITTKVREYKEWQRIIEEAEAAAKAIKDEIKTQMGDTEELHAGEYKVTWKPVTSNRFDSAAFKSTHGELYAQYTKPQTTRRFCVA